MDNLRIVIADNSARKTRIAEEVARRIFPDAEIRNLPIDLYDQRMSIELAVDIMSTSPQLVILDLGLTGKNDPEDSRGPVARRLHLMCGDDLTMFLFTDGSEGWESEVMRRAAKLSAGITHGAGSSEELESALLALKAEKFPKM